MVDKSVSNVLVDGLIQCLNFLDSIIGVVRCVKQNGGKLAHALPCMKLTMTFPLVGCFRPLRHGIGILCQTSTSRS